ncbi:MAG: chemotaxis protein CheW [Candidatus Melainabacteria bacterium]|nr:chemotaxis protein CheW [Candidatus Melainabacteria bacterium]
MLEFLTFELNETKMALPVEAVASIFEAVAFHPSKVERLGILGDFNLHGEMIPVLNLDRHWNREPTAIKLDSQIIVLRLNDGRIAIVADDVKGTIKVAKESVISLNAVLPEDALKNPHGLTLHENEIYYVLDIESLLDARLEELLHA